jgi:hypothetical protein
MSIVYSNAEFTRAMRRAGDGYLGVEILLEGMSEERNWGVMMDRLDKRGSDYRILMSVMWKGKEKDDGFADTIGVDKRWVSVRGAVSEKDWVEDWM